MKNNPVSAAKQIFVKVFGFSDVELEALSVACLASESRAVAYTVWSDGAPQKARVLLVDGDSWEAVVALANPQYDELRLVWVGDMPPANAWRFFSRPLDWDAVLSALDHHYAPDAAMQAVGPAVNLDLDLTGAVDRSLGSGADLATEPMPLEPAEPTPGGRVLVIDADNATRLYWRAKLSAIGQSLIDEAATAEAARQRVCFQVYDLVVIDLNLPDASSWTLLKEVSASRPAIRHIIVTGDGLSSLDSARAWFAGAKYALPKPFHPGNLKEVLKKLFLAPL